MCRCFCRAPLHKVIHNEVAVIYIGRNPFIYKYLSLEPRKICTAGRLPEPDSTRSLCARRRPGRQDVRPSGGRRVLADVPASAEFVESQSPYSKGAPQMWETRPVEFVLDLPHDIACTVEEVSHRDPDYLRRIIRYGIARRAVYQSLERRMDTPAVQSRDSAAVAPAFPHTPRDSAPPPDALPPSGAAPSDDRTG